MSCNPSFGGIGKGHLLREIDALDGLSPRICDEAGIHFRVLNRSKGPAVWGPRAQIDRQLYKAGMQRTLKTIPGLDILSGTVEDVTLASQESGVLHRADSRDRVTGVILGDGSRIEAGCVILTTGTFLRGEINLGRKVTPAGRRGEGPAVGLALTLEKLGFTLGRLRTGTPPRLDGRTIDYSRLLPQPSEDPPVPFSFMTEEVAQQGRFVQCHMTHTNKAAHDIVGETLADNVHIKEEVKGPRYCPSIESKVLRFKDKHSHQVWLEPEGLSTDVVYPNGISMTMPEEAQERFVRLLPGLENAQIVAPGYGVAYDYVDPRQLFPHLETKAVENLFLAGQINGTTGYEEAASQGIMAGINAALLLQERDPFVLDRADGYIGVLIDDLTSHGVMEPYRMFTSRAEYRLLLRADNADARLTHKGYAVGCVSELRKQCAEDIAAECMALTDALRGFELSTHAWEKSGALKKPLGHDGRSRSAWDLLCQRFVDADGLLPFVPAASSVRRTVLERVQSEGLYSALLKRQSSHISAYRRETALKFPPGFDFARVATLPQEAIDRLKEEQPATLGAASRIQGVTPAAIVALMQHVRKHQALDQLRERSTEV